MKKIIKSVIINLYLIFMVSSVFGQVPRDFAFPLQTSITENPPSILFAWEPITGDSIISICRKSKDATEWGNPIVQLPANATQYTDNTVEIGVEYEYRILKETSFIYPSSVLKNWTSLEEWKEEHADMDSLYKQIICYVNAGIKLPEVENRGKVILLVDSSFVDSLRNDLALFESDLIGDGWKVLRKDVSRNASVKYIKNIIRDLYNSDTAYVKSVVLFGHIPVPYSGCSASDWHVEELGAWQADMYYGSMNEEIWTDEFVGIDTAMLHRRSENNNIPGDGKFDLSVLPPDENISLQIGRIDLCKMLAFPLSEALLLRNYIHKNHDFRHKKIDPKLQALVDDHFYWGAGTATALGAWRNFTSLLNSSNVKAGTYLNDMRKKSYIWSYGCGPGNWEFTSIGGVVTTTDFVNQSPRTVFTSLFSSGSGNWDYRDNVLRAALASNGWTLTSCWEAYPYFIFHQMGMGETIGYCLRSTQNNINTYDYNSDNRAIHVNLLGDPTLRMHIVCPVNTLQSAITADSSVMLAWKPADDSIIGYYIYKLDTLENKYNRITPSPVAETLFEDTLPDAGNNYYMVRTFKLSQVASGSYYNLSQGIFDTINYVEQTPIPVSGIDLSLNPDNALPLKIYDPFIIDVNISPADATNKLLKWSVENMEGEGKFDKNGDIFPVKGGKIAIIAEALDGSGITGRLEVDINGIPDAAGTITGDTSGCRDNSEKLYTIPEIRGAYSYIWTLPNGVSDTVSYNEIIYVLDSTAASGNIKVKGHNPYADGDESTMYVAVYEVPPKPVVTLIGNILHSNAPSGNQWYISPGTMIEGATDSIYTPVEEGTYYVKVTLNNCSSRNSNKIKFIPTIIDVTNFTSESVIYPNPSAGQFIISFGTIPLRDATIKVFNLQGRLVYSETFQNKVEANIDLAAFPKGMYMINVITDDKIYYGKICME
jgi:hypothetical protein